MSKHGAFTTEQSVRTLHEMGLPQTRSPIQLQAGSEPRIPDRLPNTGIGNGGSPPAAGSPARAAASDACSSPPTIRAERTTGLIQPLWAAASPHAGNVHSKPTTVQRGTAAEAALNDFNLEEYHCPHCERDISDFIDFIIEQLLADDEDLILSEIDGAAEVQHKQRRRSSSSGAAGGGGGGSWSSY